MGITPARRGRCQSGTRFSKTGLTWSVPVVASISDDLTTFPEMYATAVCRVKRRTVAAVGSRTRERQPE